MFESSHWKQRRASRPPISCPTNLRRSRRPAAEPAVAIAEPQATSENPHQGPDRGGPGLFDQNAISGTKPGDLPPLGAGGVARQGNRVLDLGDADRRRGRDRRRDPSRRSREQRLVWPGDSPQQRIEGGPRHIQKSQVGGRASPFVVTTERAKQTSAAAIVNLFAVWYRALGFNGCSSHSGRRGFITNAARKIGTVGGSLRDVQLLAGHSSLSTTQRYIEAHADAQRRIVELV